MRRSSRAASFNRVVDSRSKLSKYVNHMVENLPARNVDAVLRALASPARRAMLERLSRRELTVGELAAPMRMTVAGVSKHLGVLERAHLVERRRAGRESRCRLRPGGLRAVISLIDRYRGMWERELDALERFLEATAEDGG
jgi:DNA-binding transcriptional ArsR family regulator